MKRSQIILLLLLCPAILFGQTEKRFLKNADKLYYAGAYTECIPLYLSILQQHYDTNINLKLAESYRQAGDITAAVYWFDKYMEYMPSDVEATLLYANLLKMSGKYYLAKEQYLQYAQYDPAGYYFAGTCDFAVNNSEFVTNYLVQNLAINTSGSDIAPSFFKQGMLFSSNGNMGIGKKGDKLDPSSGLPFYKLYYVTEDNTNYPSSVQPLKNIEQNYNNAAVAYDALTETIYITRNNYTKDRLVRSREKTSNLSIYSGFVEGLNIYKLHSFDWNDKSYSIGHPFVVPGSGMLLFVSDMPGGLGGTDLYYCTMTEDGWSEPINMGQPVNTPGNEMFPFISGDGVLYFASDYHPGFGGLDIFASYREDGSWSKPSNPGMPLNSSMDDFGLIIRNGDGYFSSNRMGGKGSDDLYRLSILQPISKLKVLDSELKPVADAEVILFENDHRIDAGKTNNKGLIKLPTQEGHVYTVNIRKEAYLETTLYDLDQYRSTTGQMIVNIMELYGTYNENSPDDGSSDDWQEDAVDTELVYELYLGAFKDPNYTRITSLSQFGELSVRNNSEGLLEFYIIYLNAENSQAALDAAKAAGFKNARIVRIQSAEK